MKMDRTKVAAVCVSVALAFGAAAWARPPEVMIVRPGAPPGAAPATQPATGAASSQPATAAGRPADEVAVAFNGVPIAQVCKFLSEKKHKPVIPHDSIAQRKITVLSPDKMPLEDALIVLSAALRQSGVIIEESERIIFLRPIEEAKQAALPVIPADQSVAQIKDKSQIVDKVFAIKHYDVTRLKDILAPMLPRYGHITADSGTRTIVVTDSVGNLERIEQVIAQLDVDTADKTVREIFKIQKGDASEIISVLRPLIEATMGKRPGTVSSATGAGAPSAASQGPSSPGPEMAMMLRMRGATEAGPARPTPPSSAAGGAAALVFIEGGQAPVMLMADVTRNWIIAVAPPDVMAQIRQWVVELDVEPHKDKGFEMFPVEYAEIDEAARQIAATIESLPNEEFRRSIRVVPFVQARKLIVFGSERGRALVRELLSKIDDPTSGVRISKEFLLKYDDAEKVAEKIEALFSGRYLDYQSMWGKSWSYERGSGRIKVVPDTRRNTVTVVADAKTIERVDQLIAEWDKPLTEGEVRPRVYTLRYQDPQQLRKLLDDMFTTQRRTEGPWFDSRTTETTPVGRLAGQFGFQVLLNSNMLVVTTKNAANYDVIDKLIEELDQPQRAGLPLIIELKHAHAEDLAEQLNALLSLPGTTAEILRSERGFTQERQKQRLSSSNPPAPAPGPTGPEGQGTPAGRMGFWWQKEPDRPDKTLASNMVGKIRFVPAVRRNALMVLAPDAYLEQIQTLIDQLDAPSLQVSIHAYVGEVEHEDVTTLGLRVAADPSILNDTRLFDSAISGGINAKYEKIFGGSAGATTLTGTFNVNILLQLLMKNYGLKVLFEPTLYTKDNQEAIFFDGQDVPVQASVKESAEGTSQTRSFEYTEVGTRLRIRPHVTQEGLVDLKINLEVSRIVPGQSTLGNFIFDRRETTTHIVIGDSQWIMLSGIVRQEDFEEVRKVPFLGDLPWIGPAFRSVDKSKRNRELVAFIRPQVTHKPQQAPADSEQKLKVLEGIKRHLDDVLSVPSLSVQAPAYARPAAPAATAPATSRPAAASAAGKPAEPTR